MPHMANLPWLPIFLLFLFTLFMLLSKTNNMIFQAKKYNYFFLKNNKKWKW